MYASGDISLNPLPPWALFFRKFQKKRLQKIMKNIIKKNKIWGLLDLKTVSVQYLAQKMLIRFKCTLFKIIKC